MWTILMVVGISLSICVDNTYDCEYKFIVRVLQSRIYVDFYSKVCTHCRFFVADICTVSIWRLHEEQFQAVIVRIQWISHVKHEYWSSQQIQLVLSLTCQSMIIDEEWPLCRNVVSFNGSILLWNLILTSIVIMNK